MIVAIFFIFRSLCLPDSVRRLFLRQVLDFKRRRGPPEAKQMVKLRWLCTTYTSGRPISLFPYRPIPIITDISDFHIGRYRCRYRYGNCHIGRYRCRYRYGNYTYSKCNKMQFCGKKVIFFFNFPNFSGIDFYKSILGIHFGGF